jgi:hypothetical protein
MLIELLAFVVNGANVYIAKLALRSYLTMIGNAFSKPNPRPIFRHIERYLIVDATLNSALLLIMGIKLSRSDGAILN